MNTVQVPVDFLQSLLQYFGQRPFAESEQAVLALRHLIQLSQQPEVTNVNEDKPAVPKPSK